MNNDSVITDFVSITGIDTSVAQQYLSRNDFNLELAINDYYQTENIEPGTKTEPKSKRQPPSTRPTAGPKFKSFSELNGGNATDPDDDDDMNFFTGGEKSALAVEDPNKKKNGRSLVDDLLEKAQREAGEPDWREQDAKQNGTKIAKTFKGTGHSLGSVDKAVESRTISDPLDRLSGMKKPEKVTRTITFWKEGFNVDDGELYRYDDPQNQAYLEQLKVGKAPLSLLNVEMFQDVDVNVIKKIDESFHDNQKSKPRVFGFHGSGNRLGSPVPGEPTTVEEAIEKYTSVPEIDKESKDVIVEGDTSIQIRFADGSKIVQKFNSTDSVQVVFDFVTSQSNTTRSWTLVTSFPPKPLDDQKEITIESAGLKNSVVTQKWI